MPADPRGISVTTPLGPDSLFLTSFRGREGLSQLFHFQLEMMAENRQVIAFDKLLGQKITFSIILPDGKTKRFWSGICSSLAQDGRDSTFTQYRMEVVPQLWLLTRRTQCRIFQYQSIPDILKAVLAGIDVKFELQGTFEKRDYCVQYRETDFDFASRLMEEEGIYYYFKHTDGGHQMIVANSPQSHAPVIFAEKAIFEELEGGNRPDMRVLRWEKTQELRSGKVTLWDHHFELPHQHLDAERPTQESVAIGKVTHKLKLPANDALELFDYPGAYAQRFDGVDRGGGDQPAEVAKIFQDNKRTAAIRMEQEAAQAITIRGSGNCRQFSAGHKFTLEKHYDADGVYVLTSVEHSATASAGGRSGSSDEVNYQNHFTCIPLALPFRPPFNTECPYIAGPQTAVVTGPPGEKIFCDKYGRLKVQFHWDRTGKNDANTSCWVRASQNWGGANWGGMFIPHVGQEVIVEFEEGDPDRPLITGRVYNAAAMPPLKLPDNKTQSIVQDHGGNFIKLQGDAGKQQIKLHSPFNNTTFCIGAPGSIGDGIAAFTDGILDFEVRRTWKVVVGSDSVTSIEGNHKEEIKKSSETYVNGNYIQTVFGDVDNKTFGRCTTFIGGIEQTVTVGMKNEVLIALNTKLQKGGVIEINNAKEILKAPDLRQAIAAVQVKYGQWKLKVSAEKKKVAGKMETKAGTIKNTADDVFVETKSAYKLKSEILEEKASTLKQKAGDMETKANNLIIKATTKIKGEVKINGTVLTASS